MTHWLVLPSPFLGPAAYGPLVDALRLVGHGASVATYAEPPLAAELIAGWAATAAGLDDVVLVPHSNAGHLAPAVSARCGGLPTVYVDAALPASSGPSPLAPPALLALLEGLAGLDGTLPRWTRWWPREDLADVLSGDWFDRIDAVVPRVPLTYAAGEIDVPPRWEQGRCAYLAFGAETYAEELSRARVLGWPVQVLDRAGHLHLIVRPDQTADLVRGLARSLTPRQPEGWTSSR